MATSLHQLKPAAHSTQEKHRVGRGNGSGWGKTAGRGQKGQKARSRSNVRIGFEGGQTPLYRRIPKVGFKPPVQTSYAIINLDQLAAWKQKQVTIADFKAKGLVGRYQKVKILARGTLNQPLTVQAHKFSQRAAEAIVAAGGKVEVIA